MQPETTYKARTRNGEREKERGQERERGGGKGQKRNRNKYRGCENILLIYRCRVMDVRAVCAHILLSISAKGPSRPQTLETSPCVFMGVTSGREGSKVQYVSSSTYRNRTPILVCRSLILSRAKHCDFARRKLARFTEQHGQVEFVVSCCA